MLQDVTGWRGKNQGMGFICAYFLPAYVRNCYIPSVRTLRLVFAYGWDAVSRALGRLGCVYGLGVTHSTPFLAYCVRSHCETALPSNRTQVPTRKEGILLALASLKTVTFETESREATSAAVRAWSARSSLSVMDSVEGMSTPIFWGCLTTG
jgi:hypothetical protein